MVLFFLSQIAFTFRRRKYLPWIQEPERDILWYGEYCGMENDVVGRLLSMLKRHHVKSIQKCKDTGQ